MRFNKLGEKPEKPVAKCYLYMDFVQRGANVSFRGYHISSDHPYHLTRRLDYAASVLQVMEGETYGEARDKMFSYVEHMAEQGLFGAFEEAWWWINPSKEAHNERYERIKSLTAQWHAEDTEFRKVKAGQHTLVHSTGGSLVEAVASALEVEE